MLHLNVLLFQAMVVKTAWRSDPLPIPHLTLAFHNNQVEYRFLCLVTSKRNSRQLSTMESARKYTRAN